MGNILYLMYETPLGEGVILYSLYYVLKTTKNLKSLIMRIK